MNKIKRIFAVLAAMAICLTFASTVSAQSSVEGYNDEGGQVQSQVESGSDDPTNEVQPVAAVGSDTGSGSGGDSGGSLPFTGLDVVLLLAAGGTLLVVGLGMRRLTRSA